MPRPEGGRKIHVLTPGGAGKIPQFVHGLGYVYSGMNTSEVKNRIKDYQGKATDMAMNAGRTTDHYVRQNTWTALGMAALLGCLVGFLLSNAADDYR